MNTAAGNQTIPQLWTLLDSSNDVIYWCSRNSDEIWCGVGCAFEDVSLDRCLDAISNIQAESKLPFAPRCFGLIAFDPRQPLRSPWSGFAEKRFWIPQILIRYQQGHSDHILLYYKNPLSPIEASDTNEASRDISEIVRERSNFPLKEWRPAIHRIQSKIRSNELKKAVLARQLELTADNPFALPKILERLAAESQDSYLFACKGRESGVFFGASPERLFRLEGTSLAVDSLAGSRPSEPELTNELALSEKDLQEQGLVTDFIREQIEPLCTGLKVTEPSVKTLATVQHLFTEITGSVRESVTVGKILTRLHPTPAVCGLPSKGARDLIAELEPDGRGLYAGVVGCAGTDSAEFAVAIRSGLIHDNRALLFAGAGIVSDSIADQEFEECNWKFAALKRAFLPTK